VSALTNRQKAYLSRLAAAAYVRLHGEATARDPRVVEEFRHAQVAAACGKAGLRCCSQTDYKLVEARLLDLNGWHAAAFNAGVSAATEKRRQAEAVLVAECDKAGLHLAYAESICRNIYKCPLSDASDRQIWNLIYTVRNRSRARRLKAPSQPLIQP
jgi:hypothetical protein